MWISSRGLPVGSSPRVRGKPLEQRRAALAAGLIPACAGKTARGSRARSSGAAHPRVCGENKLDDAPSSRTHGSSPRVRGKHIPSICLVVPKRLIPACAGKTRNAEANGNVEWAHPRVCGENLLIAPHVTRHTGSSPRVRGKPHQQPAKPTRWRLIPACAGKTPGNAPNGPLQGAHPRVCGENGRFGVST